MCDEDQACVSLFVAGAVLGEGPVSLYVAGALLCSTGIVLCSMEYLVILE